MYIMEPQTWPAKAPADWTWHCAFRRTLLIPEQALSFTLTSTDVSTSSKLLFTIIDQTQNS